LAAHFTLWVLAALAAGVLISLWLRSSSLTIANAMVAAVLLLYGSEYLQRAKELDVEHDPTVSLVSFNVHAANSSKPEVMNFLNQLDADLVLLMEVNETWAAFLEEMRPRYPYRALHVRSDAFGMALLSKRPMTWSFLKAGPDGVPYLDARIDHRVASFRFIGVHALPPVSRDNWLRAHRQIDTILRTVRGDELVVMAGDFNTTPNGSLYRRIVRSGHFRSVGASSPFRPTWGPLLATLQIDHVFVSPEWWTTPRRVGPAYGSDHRPVYCEVVLTPVLFARSSKPLKIR
ncbi:MAG: endonuclease/exonuclease/phosphatase family protein, partial [Phycisphaeraceae bacterium]|nr:endonuclease/exonuclease/phosphatase family protein [Phycisphaeraceae bacterium]